MPGGRLRHKVAASEIPLLRGVVVDRRGSSVLRIDTMVSKADAFRVYVSLVATTCPLLATRLNRNCPLLVFLRTNFIYTTSKTSAIPAAARRRTSLSGPFAGLDVTRRLRPPAASGSACRSRGRGAALDDLTKLDGNRWVRRGEFRRP